jgi:hypothetical protein
MEVGAEAAGIEAALGSDSGARWDQGDDGKKRQREDDQAVIPGRSLGAKFSVSGQAVATPTLAKRI